MCILKGPSFSILVCWLEEYRSGSLFYSSLSLSQVAKKSVYGTIWGSSKEIPKWTHSSWCLHSMENTPPPWGPRWGQLHCQRDLWGGAAQIQVDSRTAFGSPMDNKRHQGRRKLASVNQWSNVFIFAFIFISALKYYFQHVHHLIWKIIITVIIMITLRAFIVEKGKFLPVSASFTKDSCFSGLCEVHWGVQSRTTGKICTSPNPWAPTGFLVCRIQRESSGPPNRVMCWRIEVIGRKSWCWDPNFALS